MSSATRSELPRQRRVSRVPDAGLADLVLMITVTGVALGVVQALVLRRWLWAAAMLLLRALGWTVTTVVGVEVADRFTVFGATGAITVSALAGLLLQFLKPARTEAPAPI